MAPAVVAAVVALDRAELVAVVAVLPAALLPVVALVVLFLQLPAHKQLPLVLLQAAAVLPAALLPVVALVAVVAALWLVQGLVASESLRRR